MAKIEANLFDGLVDSAIVGRFRLDDRLVGGDFRGGSVFDGNRVVPLGREINFFRRSGCGLGRILGNDKFGLGRRSSRPGRSSFRGGRLLYFVLGSGHFRGSFLDGEFRDRRLRLRCLGRRRVQENWSFFVRCRGRGNGTAFFVALGQFAVFCRLFGMVRFRINALQRSAAKCSFGETASTSMQSGQALIDAEIGGCHRQGGDQRSQGLGGHVVRDEKLGVG